MVKFLVSITLTLVSFFSFAQNKLEILDTKSGKIRAFNTGNSFLFIPDKDSIFIKGKIEEINEDSVTLLLLEEARQTVKFAPNNINTIRKPTRFQYLTYAAGALLMLNGTYFVLTGQHITDSHWTNRGLGLISFAIGLSPFLVNPKTYDFGSRYKLQISR